MKNFCFLLAIVLLSSCSGIRNSSYRQTGFKLRKATPVTTVQAEKQISAILASSAEQPSPSLPQTASAEPVAQLTSPVPSVIDRTGETAPSSTDLRTEPEDTLSEGSQEIVNQALMSEKKARKSRNLGIAGIILMFVPVLGIVGLILSIISFYKWVRCCTVRHT